jgi:tripartite-type tricarboxylate transporter receptor subunit TctC
MNVKKFIAKTLVALSLVPVLAFAWEPTKPVTVIVGNTPGAGNEIAFRKLAEIVQRTNPKFIFVVQNIPGADSVVAQNRFIDAAPDGHTVNLPSHMSTYVTNDIWQKDIKKFNYDSFTDVLTMGKSPLVLVASPKSMINTPEDFITLIAKTNKPVNIATGGGAHRTAFEYLMFRGQGNKDLVKPIRFNGPMPAVTSVATFDLKGGTEFGIMPIAVAKPLIDAGKVKAIGFTGTRKMEQYPKVPLLNTVAPGINVYAAWSLQLPPKTSADIVEWYQREFSKAVLSIEYKEWANNQVVFIEEAELVPAGLRQHMNDLRSTFLPVLQTIDLSKE